MLVLAVYYYSPCSFSVFFIVDYGFGYYRFVDLDGSEALVGVLLWVFFFLGMGCIGISDSIKWSCGAWVFWEEGEMSCSG